MKITFDMLAKRRACEMALAEFTSRYGDAVEVTQELVKDDRWARSGAGWVADNLFNAGQRIRFEAELAKLGDHDGETVEDCPRCQKMPGLAVAVWNGEEIV